MEISIVGGGLAGLTAAFYAKKNGHNVTLWEASNRVGGVVRSERKAGFLLEYGPNTVQSKPNLFSLIEDLNLTGQMQLADVKTPRYIFCQGKLQPLPLSPLNLLSTQLLTLQGKIKLLKEPFISKRTSGGDETLHSFVQRRLGEEIADNLMAPFVSGVWAGDSHQLSADAFPRLTEMERNHGSLLKGIFFGQKSPPSPKKKYPKGLVSFSNGIETLISALETHLKPQIKIASPIRTLQKENNRWILRGENFQQSADHVFLCAPASATAKIITPFAQEAAFTLNQIPSADVALVHLGFQKENIGAPRPGFGFLSAPKEKSDILGCLWNSNLFENRAPEGTSLWTVFMGGFTNPKILRETDPTLLRMALDSLRPLMGLKGDPIFTEVTRINKAIPQYTLGHAERMRLLDETEKSHPGLHFLGNYRGGIAVGDVITQAKTQSQKV